MENVPDRLQADDAIGPTGPIPEHKAAGRPVRLVLVSNGRNPDDVAHRPTNDGTISDVRSHHVHAYERPRDERADGAAYVLNVPGSHMKAKRNAIHACNTWDPSRNPYALGHRSVPEPLEAAHADPREAAHTPPSDHRPGKGN
ncbi:hypothetical protein [Streptomyces sp. NPDC057052]|uniref:hypothetical protein n=1 Tax=Streptomyces sp. NPDC057052 TaxID=3346010 RepID=UPI00362A1ED6